MTCWSRCCVGAVLRQHSGDAFLVWSPRGPRQDLFKPSWAIFMSASRGVLVAVPPRVYLRTMQGASWNRRQVVLRARPFTFGSRDSAGSSRGRPHTMQGPRGDHVRPLGHFSLARGSSKSRDWSSGPNLSAAFLDPDRSATCSYDYIPVIFSKETFVGAK